MRYQVRVTQEAEDHISSIVRYISEDSPQNAWRWRIRLRERLRSLKDFPERNEIAFRASDVGHDVRHTFFGVYRILYAVDVNTVVILGIRHGARRPPTADDIRDILPPQ